MPYINSAGRQQFRHSIGYDRLLQLDFVTFLAR
uniref:Uncharacterized protein n=1 Tax=Anguilla anguilla TaxID=7936 RepID=A0A0E9VQY1_ANGAN